MHGSFQNQHPNKSYTSTAVEMAKITHYSNLYNVLEISKNNVRWLQWKYLNGNAFLAIIFCERISSALSILLINNYY